MRAVTVAAALFAITFSARTVEAQSAAGFREFSPITAAAPASISKVLTPDSTWATSSKGAPARVGEENNGCRVVLRDPKNGARYILIESQVIEEEATSREGRTVETRERQGNYLLTDGKSDISVPVNSRRQFIRVACATNRVLGLARAISAGT
jgi:hypothetical protein